MHEAREREDQEDRHAEDQVRLEDRVRISDQHPGIAAQQQDALRPVHELHHLVAVEMSHGDRDGGETQQKLREQDQQDGDVAEGRGGADARIEQAPVRQQRDADQAEDAGDAADPDRHQLLEAVA